MLLFILLIFINSNLLKAEYDESSENKYIDLLPEKEKREFFETVARRILEEVKSKEADSGLVSGEITDEQLKLHSEYVSRLLKEETENLKRRHQLKNDTDILKTNADSTTTNVDETEGKIEDIEKAIEKIQAVEQEKVVNDSKLILRANDAEEKNQHQENDKSKQNDKNVHIDLTLREGDKSKSKEQEVKNVLKVTETETGYPIVKDKTDNDENIKAIDLTLRRDTTTEVTVKVKDEKQGTDYNNLTPQQGKEIDTNSNNGITTGKDKTNKQVDKITSKSHKKGPVSIEITFVNDEDYKEDPEKSKNDKKHEIPVKVVYDEKNVIEKASTTITNTNKGLTVSANKNKDTKLKTEEKRSFRKSLLENIDDKVQDIEHTFNNQVSRKKRKSKSDTDSDTVSSTRSVDVDVTQSNINQQSGKPDDVEDKVQSTNNKNLNTDLTHETFNNLTLETTTENAQDSTFSNPEIVNHTEILLLEKLETTTEKIETKRSHDENFESTTTKDEVYHTQINDFDANENETLSDSVVTANFAGTTTEEIVNVRTKYISGYPEDSPENLTSIVKKRVDTINASNTIENATNVNHAESNLNSSFYALKLSDKEANLSFKTEEMEDLNLNKSDKVRAGSNDSVVQYISSTTIGSLTTIKVEEKKEIFLREAPAEIQNDSVIVLKDHNNYDEKPPPAPKIIYGADDIPEKMLRNGLKPDNGEDVVVKIEAPRKEYLVYEILPGQQPFVKKKSNKKRSEKLNPKLYPKLTQYIPNQDKSMYNEQPSQIEHPKYAPVYNYAPEYAYFNPKNKYGLNPDDEEAKIVDERSHESDTADIEKIFDYEFENKNQKRVKNEQGSLVLQMVDRETPQREKNDRIDEDYYFGKDANILRTSVQNPKQWMKKIMCKGKYCKEPIETVVQDPQVPPNSDERQHAHNAMLNKNPPVTHYRQVKSILANLGYFPHDHTHLHNLKCNHNKTENFHGSGETWLGPHLDLFYNKKVDKNNFIRSGGDRQNRKDKTLLNKLISLTIPRYLREEIKDHLNEINGAEQIFTHDKKNIDNSRVSFKIPKHVQDKMKTRLLAMNESYHKNTRGGGSINSVRNRPMVLLTGRPTGLSKHAFKKRPLFLLTGRHKGISKHIDHKTPLLLLTGGLNENGRDNDNKNALVLLTGRLNEHAKRSDRKRKNKKKVILDLSEDYDDLDKSIVRHGSFSVDDYQDPNEVSSVSSEESKRLKNLNPDVVNMIISMSKNSTDKNYQRKLIEKFKKASKLYNPPEKPRKNVYKDIEKELWALRSRSEVNLEPYVKVMTDMIKTNNKGLINYDWLSTTVDIRSTITKLLKLCEILRKDGKEIHPKDLQLVKYILYLHSSTKYLFDQESDEASSNLRFSYGEKESEHNWRRRDHHSSRRFGQRPWLNQNGLKEKVVDLSEFFEDLGHVLDDLHDAIKHIALVTNYRNQRWFENLKEVYLKSPPTRKQVLEVILHVQTARLIGLIEESAANGLQTNYVRYGLNNPNQVDRSKEEFAFVVQLYLELKKLQ